jgi:uncharacterized membrane protein
MQIGNFAGDYEAKTDEELLRLAMELDQLTSEAQTHLTREFAKRGIGAEQIRAFREEEELRRIGRPGKPEPVASSPMVLGRDSYTIGPPLPSETSKAPWRPKVAGRIAFFFGPVAGALIVAISLRRMGCQQTAKKVTLLATGAAAAEAVILFFVPDALSRLIGFGAEIAFLLIFPIFMEHEFSEWQATHPSATPSNGWNSIGWGLVGAAMFLVTSFLVFLGLSALLPTSMTPR